MYVSENKGAVCEWADEWEEETKMIKKETMNKKGWSAKKEREYKYVALQLHNKKFF